MTIGLLVLDTETTGVDAENDRIVTAFAAYLGSDGTVLDSLDLLIAPMDPNGDPVSIPDGAAAVHGITNAVLAEHIAHQNDILPGGLNYQPRVRTPAQALNRLSTFLDSYTSRGVPIAGANLAYDLTLIDREARRHLRIGDGFQNWLQGIPVLDSLVLDKAIDKYRKGSRKLIDTAAYYGIHFTEEEAHNASFDALTSGRIIQKILATPQLLHRFADPEHPTDSELRALHADQVAWKAEQSASLEAYLRSPKNKNGADPQAVVSRDWPMIPYAAATTTATNQGVPA